MTLTTPAFSQKKFPEQIPLDQISIYTQVLEFYFFKYTEKYDHSCHPIILSNLLLILQYPPLTSCNLFYFFFENTLNSFQVACSCKNVCSISTFLVASALKYYYSFVYCSVSEKNKLYSVILFWDSNLGILYFRISLI